MELSELLAAAWTAVEKSGVPPDQRSVAFREAISILREDSGNGQTTSQNGKPGASVKKRAAAPRPRSSVSSDSESDPINLPSEDDFFARLADESGVDETDLRDILQLRAAGTSAPICTVRGCPGALRVSGGWLGPSEPLSLPYPRRSCRQDELGGAADVVREIGACSERVGRAPRSRRRRSALEASLPGREIADSAHSPLGRGLGRGARDGTFGT